jgi:hypothetical protein
VRGQQWLLAAAAVGALFGMTAAWQRVGHSSAALAAPIVLPDVAEAQTSLEPADTFRLVWSEPMANLRSDSLSEDGQSVVTVSTDGQVRLWDWAHRPNRPLWSKTVPGVTCSVVGVGHHTVLVYAALDPTRPTLTLLGDKGRLIGGSTLDGSIWAAALSTDGSHAGVTTGNSSLYLYTLGPHLVLHRQSLAGIGDSVSLSPDAARFAVGTWDTSGIACYAAGGAMLWQYPLATSTLHLLSNRLFETQMAQNGQTVLGLSCANVHGEDGTLYYWRGDTGKPAWRYSLPEDAFSPHAQISANGMCVAVTYTQLVTHGDQSVSEQHLVVLDSEGNTEWEKGGMLFSPTLVSIAADGHRVTVTDGNNTLYHLDNTGRITTPYVFRAPISQTIKTVGTADGRWLLVPTQDGLLNLVRMD